MIQLPPSVGVVVIGTGLHGLGRGGHLALGGGTPTSADAPRFATGDRH
jgi:hypothetical protein